jgi:predicted nicotinamide N-methyase
MAFDAIRNEAYEAAIRRAVTSDSVVLDLGSGLGMHAMMAARAGARRVFMVEPENVIHCAHEVARGNGFESVIEPFQGKIEQITLPEKVDVIISVFTGNMLYSEDLLPSLYYARDRWLKPGGTMIPNGAELLIAPICATQVYERHVSCWLSRPHGFDYSTVARFATNDMFAERDDTAMKDAFLLADAKAIATEDFYVARESDFDARTDFAIHTPGVCHAIHSWIRLQFGGDSLATGPLHPPMHWTPQNLPLEPPIPLNEGSALSCRLRRPSFGDWTWDVSTAHTAQKRSTFLASPHVTSRIAARSERTRLSLNARGRALLRALDLMNASHTNGAIADVIFREFEAEFVTRASAGRFVANIAETYGAEASSKEAQLADA